jgi:D-tyrosyl-tRNA(Tyr) deacylase
MRAVVQRVREAWVDVAEERVAHMGHGVLVRLGVARDDTAEDAIWMARKVARLRIFDDEEGRLNHDCLQAQGAFLAVSQFTLYGNCAKGNRPSYIQAAAPDHAHSMYELFVEQLKAFERPVQTGRFQAHMMVGLVNDGPVTVIIDSPLNKQR